MNAVPKVILSQCLNLGKTELCVSPSLEQTLCYQKTQLTGSQPLPKQKELGIKKGFVNPSLNKSSYLVKSKNMKLISKIPKIIDFKSINNK